MSKYYKDGKYFPIPKAPFYVLSNDPFLGGWGPAKGKINTCVVPCQTYEDAGLVVKYVESRNDQKYIRIVSHKPRTKDHVLYSLLEAWRQNAGIRADQPIYRIASGLDKVDALNKFFFDLKIPVSLSAGDVFKVRLSRKELKQVKYWLAVHDTDRNSYILNNKNENIFDLERGIDK